jgi:hypothetical protein
MNANIGPPDGGILANLLTGQVTHGVIARWSENAGWTTREGQPLPSPMLLLGFGTVLRRWKDKRPYWNTDSPLPDPETLNSAIPVEEWELDLSGQRTPPWKLCYVFYLVNVTTGRLYTFAHDTYGTLRCYDAIKEQCFVKQWLTGTFVMPIVQLEKAPWKSAKYGMQMGPHFEPIDWREPPRMSGGNLVQQTPAPQLSGPTPQLRPRHRRKTKPCHGRIRRHSLRRHLRLRLHRNWRRLIRQPRNQQPPRQRRQRQRKLRSSRTLSRRRSRSPSQNPSPMSCRLIRLRRRTTKAGGNAQLDKNTRGSLPLALSAYRRRQWLSWFGIWKHIRRPI